MACPPTVRGLAPFFNPAVSKADGHNVVIVDIQAADGLRERVLRSELIPSTRAQEIEEVDIVGDASSITTLVKNSPYEGNFCYIVSSHNFEHLPNPIKFLRGCTVVLKEGGMLSMAIPDYRCCFDHFRFPTRLSDWLRAYREDISAPDADMVLDSVSLRSRYREIDEFFAHLRKTSNPSRDAEAFYIRRVALLRDIDHGLGSLSFDLVRNGTVKGYTERDFSLRRITYLILGEKGMTRLRGWNRQRRKKRRARDSV